MDRVKVAKNQTYFMKKRFKITISALAVTCAVIGLSLSSYSPAPETIAAPGGSFTRGTFPVFNTKVDTVVTTATDSIKLPLHKNYFTNNNNDLNSLSFSVSVWKATTGTTVVPSIPVALYASSNNGLQYGTAPIYSTTLTPSALYTASLVNAAAVTALYAPNNGIGNIYTDYMWVITGAATNTISTQTSVTIR